MRNQFDTPEDFTKFFIEEDDRLNRKRNQLVQEEADRKYLEALHKRVSKINQEAIASGHCPGATYVI